MALEVQEVLPLHAAHLPQLEGVQGRLAPLEPLDVVAIGSFGSEVNIDGLVLELPVGPEVFLPLGHLPHQDGVWGIKGCSAPAPSHRYPLPSPFMFAGPMPPP
jgi:hypothetical protein